jgi:hypothetical protein
MDYVLNHWQLIAVVLGVIILLLCYRWVLALCGVILIPDDSVGIMTKKFVILGKNRRLPAGRIIALNGEAGYQADTLPPGLQVIAPGNYRINPFLFSVQLADALDIPDNKFRFNLDVSQIICRPRLRHHRFSKESFPAPGRRATRSRWHSRSTTSVRSIH